MVGNYVAFLVPTNGLLYMYILNWIFHSVGSIKKFSWFYAMNIEKVCHYLVSKFLSGSSLLRCYKCIFLNFIYHYCSSKLSYEILYQDSLE